MRRGVLLLLALAAAACGSNAGLQPVVIDLSQKSPTPAATPSAAPSPTPSAARIEPAAPPGTAAAAPTAAAPEVGRVPSSSESRPEAVVDRQLAAFNRRDLDAFLGFYAADAKLYDYPDRLAQAGAEQIREQFARRFSESPGLHATVSHRIVQGGYVVDQQDVQGTPGGPHREVVIYQVEDARIAKAWRMR